MYGFDINFPTHSNREQYRSRQITPEEKFLKTLKSTRKTLDKLDRSLQKSSEYEERLVKCRSSHYHSHDSESYSEAEEQETKRSRTESAKSSRNQLDVTETWPTMSIVCLQYQYEELSKRYEALLKSYSERSNALDRSESALTNLKHKIKSTLAQLAQANEALLTVGEKYLVLRSKTFKQTYQFEEKIDLLRRMIRGLAAAAIESRKELDRVLSNKMAMEEDDRVVLLLAEISKCNRLCLENLRLKAKIEELAPGSVTWRSSETH